MDNSDQSKSHFDLKTLLETSRMLVESRDPEFILNNLLLIAMGKVMAPRAVVLFYDDDEKHYYTAKKKGRFVRQDLNEISPNAFLHPNNEKASFSLNREELPACLQDDEMTTLFNIRTGERHLGFLCLGKRMSGKPLDEAETGFLESLVFMSAVAVDNSFLVKELREANHELDIKVQEMHTLFDLSKEFNATIDRDQIFRIFRFALMGQMQIKTFFLITQKKDKAILLADSGLISKVKTEDFNELFDLDESVITVDQEMRNKCPSLNENNIEVMLRLKYQENQPAYLVLGKRGGGRSYKEYDFSFLVSLGNLVLLSLHKTYLLEEQLEKKRIEEELNLARIIQRKLLPDNISGEQDLEIAAVNIPSQQVGGDYYDIIRRENEWVLAIADVTGKGVPASLLMANLQAMLHVIVPLNMGLAEATEKMNTILYQNTEPDKFVSFFWGTLNVDSRVFRYVNAGHNPPYVYRSAGETFEKLSTGGILLGAMPSLIPYAEGTVTLGKNDVLVLFTDGVTEAMNELRQEYAESRLKECIKANLNRNSREIMECIVEDVKTFSGNHLGDDLTLMVVRGLNP